MLRLVLHGDRKKQKHVVRIVLMSGVIGKLILGDHSRLKKIFLKNVGWIQPVSLSWEVVAAPNLDGFTNPLHGWQSVKLSGRGGGCMGSPLACQADEEIKVRKKRKHTVGAGSLPAQPHASFEALTKSVSESLSLNVPNPLARQCMPHRGLMHSNKHIKRWAVPST